METVERVQLIAKQAEVVLAKGGVGASAGVVEKRVPSETAKLANDAFAELRRYFRTAAQLGRALQWSAPTLRTWSLAEGPARPRLHSVERIFHLNALAGAARRWVSDPHQVGDWLLEPNERLGNVTPVRVVHVLGQEGVDGLINNMAAIAPRERVSTDDVELDADALRETLRHLGAPSIADAKGGDEADLSDLSFD